jgi:hypothetical protein
MQLEFVYLAVLLRACSGRCLGWAVRRGSEADCSLQREQQVSVEGVQFRAAIVCKSPQAQGRIRFDIDLTSAIDDPENGSWTETILHSFINGKDGVDPQSTLTFAWEWIDRIDPLATRHSWRAPMLTQSLVDRDATLLVRM